jgi:hypothetical protein
MKSNGPLKVYYLDPCDPRKGDGFDSTNLSLLGTGENGRALEREGI